MKLPGYVLAPLCLLGFCICSIARANVYTYTAADGSVSLSNVPEDSRYIMLVPEQKVGGGRIIPAGVGRVAAYPCQQGPV